MKHLKIQNSNKFAIVDDEDFERLSHFIWKASARSNNIQRAKREGSKIKMFSLASEIMEKHGQMFDHKDRNPFNNQKDNLRECNYQGNSSNSTKQKNTSSQYKGVHRNRRCCKWQASIRVDYSLIHLGLFDLEVDAAKAYNIAALKHFGEFANLNSI